MSLSVEKTQDFVNKTFEESIVSTLCEYISIPNASPMFDKEWATNGYQEKAVDLLVNWAKAQKLERFSLEVVKLENRTPLIFCEIEGVNTQETVLLYGHLDKQPPLTESWKKPWGPYTPVIENNKLYGRGGADDGYSIFSAITAIKALQLQGVPHARCVLIIEACEESGSPDLPFYIKHLESRIGSPSLIVCLDSGCGNYEQFWITTSLRGMLAGNLEVRVLNDGVHSGHGSGIVPSSFRIIRHLLSRIENPETGEILIKDLFVDIPVQRLQQTQECAKALGEEIHQEFGWHGNTGPITTDLTQLLLNRTWRPTLSVTGVDGIPALSDAGNVLRTHTSLKLSIRLPPGVHGPKAAQVVKEVLEKDPPYGAKVTFNADKTGSGWESPPLAPWLEASLNKASNSFYNKPANFLGEGGSIPFMGMLGEKFPKAQFVITGVLGPDSNAHGPNEMLDLNMAKNITSCVASILSDHYQEFVAKK